MAQQFLLTADNAYKITRTLGGHTAEVVAMSLKRNVEFKFAVEVIVDGMTLCLTHNKTGKASGYDHTDYDLDLSPLIPKMPPCVCGRYTDNPDIPGVYYHEYQTLCREKGNTFQNCLLCHRYEVVNRDKKEVIAYWDSCKT